MNDFKGCIQTGCPFHTEQGCTFHEHYRRGIDIRKEGKALADALLLYRCRMPELVKLASYAVIGRGIADEEK